MNLDSFGLGSWRVFSGVDTSRVWMTRSLL